MQVLYNTVISNEAPSLVNSLWLKPVDGGFTLYALFNGKWQALKLVNDNATSQVNDDKVKTNFKVTDITALTKKQCNALNLGDQVIKVTDGKKQHLYTVTYKNEVDGAMCLNYFDAENIEEVYYEKTGGNWGYVETTITPLVTG